MFVLYLGILLLMHFHCYVTILPNFSLAKKKFNFLKIRGFGEAINYNIPTGTEITVRKNVILKYCADRVTGQDYLH